MSNTNERLTEALADRYRIERRLGEGGMATVFLAEDLRHERNVALKVLRPELAAVLGADRFLTEIKTTANLQHPHILPLFDSGESDGFLYYVMPYVEGESLREKIDRDKQLGVEEAVRIADEVADALDYAHRNDVIHRDIKPENILLHDGRPVVADFGIALAVSAAADGRMTETGLSLGTPHYMSPEQATADRDLTVRSDVYALGCVLYEMLTGDPPHTGPTAQSVLVRILTETPRPVTDVRASVPRNVAGAVARAIEKLPADRFESVDAFRKALADPGFEHAVRHPAAPAVQLEPAVGEGKRRPVRPSAGGRFAVGVAVVAVLVALAGWLRPTPAPRVTRLGMTLPGTELPRTSPFTRFDISPDGRTLVHETSDGPLHVRRLDQFTSVPLPGTESAIAPKISPDGRFVLFRRLGTGIFTAALDGAPPLEIAKVPAVAAMDWGEDGFVYFSLDGDIHRIPASGGDPEQLTDASGTDDVHAFPAALPGGNGVIFSERRPSQGTSVLKAVDFASGEVRELVEGLAGVYAPSGHLVFGRADGSLAVAPFDPESFEVGPVAPLVQGVSLRAFSLPEFALSSSGHLVYFADGSEGPGSARGAVIVRATPGGPVEAVDAERLVGGFTGLTVSPDGRRLAVVTRSEVGADTDLWVYDLQQGTYAPVTTAEGSEDRAIWSVDGSNLYYISSTDPRTLFEIPADASGPSRSVLTLDEAIEDVARSEDGRYLVFKTVGPQNNDLWYVDLAGDSIPQPFLASETDEDGGRLSPDGRWIAYHSDESGRDEVYVRAFPGGGPRIPISLDGGSVPMWSRSGDEIFYATSGNGGDLIGATVQIVGATLSVTSRRTVMTGSYAWGTGEADYDVLPGDEGFYAISLTGTSDEGELRIVLNWLEEVKERTAR
jgi:serine/threonine-protein kinase